MRSETPDIAIELSLQPWRAFKPDGVIFFSDILTPLPALGIEFDMVKGKGPVIAGAPHLVLLQPPFIAALEFAGGIGAAPATCPVTSLLLTLRWSGLCGYGACDA